MCNDLIVNYGGICGFCNVWSVQKRHFYECRNETGAEIRIKSDWECDWPDGHPTGKPFRNRALYEIGRENGLDVDLPGPCIRCESEQEWDNFLNRAAMDPNCDEYFENYLYDHHPDDLSDDPDNNKWWRRPYDPARLEKAGFNFHTWRDPVAGERKIRDVEGPFKYHHSRHFMITQEEQRIHDSDEDTIKELNARFDQALLDEHSDQAKEIQQIRENDRVFRQRDDDRDYEDHPEQPYLNPGFEYMDDTYLYPDFSEVLPYVHDDEESEVDSSYEEESMDVEGSYRDYPLLPPHPGDNVGFDEFFDGAEDVVYGA